MHFIQKDFCFLAFLPIFDIDILQNSVQDLKIATRLVTVNNFNSLRKKMFWPEKVGGGLATG